MQTFFCMHYSIGQNETICVNGLCKFQISAPAWILLRDCAGCSQMPQINAELHGKHPFHDDLSGTEESELNLSLRNGDDFIGFQIYKASGLCWRMNHSGWNDNSRTDSWVSVLVRKSLSPWRDEMTLGTEWGARCSWCVLLCSGKRLSSWAQHVRSVMRFQGPHSVPLGFCSWAAGQPYIQHSMNRWLWCPSDKCFCAHPAVAGTWGFPCSSPRLLCFWPVPRDPARGWTTL